MTIGRWTNYPGYYSRQFTVAQMKPDFPYQGPHGISSIYFHHIPGQLGMTIDYLFAEHHARSDGLVSFPRAHEADYVFFVFDVYGHAPGTFHGEDGVWPWFPAGIITLDNPAINWLTGVGNDSLYISLTNSSPVDQQVTINLVSPITGITADTAIELHQFGSTGTERRRPLRGAAATVTVPGHGHLGLVARGVQVDVPWHRTQVRPGLPGPDGIQAWDVTTVGGEPVQGMVLVRPDASGYDVHVSVDSTTESTLRWRVDDQPWQTPGPKVFPYEWTLSVNQLDATVTYEVTVGTEVSPPIELTAPTILTGGLGIHAAATTVPGGSFEVTTNGAGTATVSLSLPTGWSATLVESSGDLVRHEVHVPASATPGEQAITAEVGSTSATTVVTVRTPTRLVSLERDQQLIAPDDTVTITALVANRGPAAVEETVEVAVPAGWSVDHPDTVAIPSGAVARVTITVTVPHQAQWGSTGSVTVGVPGSRDLTSAIVIRTDPSVLHNELAWPEYAEQGEWLTSGLRGWNNITTRYSAEGVTGGSARWVPVIPSTGTYEVSVWYPTHPSSTTEATYVVRHPGGDSVTLVDQTSTGDDWVRLGVFALEPGAPAEVILDVVNAGVHRASAARFRLLGEDDLRPMVVMEVPELIEAGASVTVPVQVRAGELKVATELRAAVPAGWTVSPVSAPVELAPGEEIEITLTFTAPASASPGSAYEVAVFLDGVESRGATAVGTPPAVRNVTGDGTPVYLETGPWKPSGLLNVDGSGTRYCTPGRDGTAVWSPAVTGRHLVRVWFPSDGASSRTAVHTISHAEGTAATTFDQRATGGSWEALGVFELAQESTVTVTASDGGALRTGALEVWPVVPAEG